ncbi:NADH-ubiquinone oxidoreductase-F iron-sulfur binding region domain-containing protein [Desulfarculus baarsii]
MNDSYKAESQRGFRLSSLEDFNKLRQRIEAQRDPAKGEIVVCHGSGCLAAGAAQVAEALESAIAAADLDVAVRPAVKITGCHGFCSCGPLVVIHPEGIFYQKVQPSDAEEIVQESLINGRPVTRLLYADPGTKEKFVRVADIPFYNLQERVVLRNIGHIDPTDITDAIAAGGYQGLAKALGEMTPAEIIEEVKSSGLRGRGGGGFPTGLKWQSCAKAEGEPKYVICNADEGDPGAYMDRSILEGDPFSVLEGMTIAAYAVGARHGFVYVRNEYPLAVVRLVGAIKQAKQYGLLGENILGLGFDFDIKISTGAGAFVCGESTALMRSLEGKVGRPRAKYIHTVEHGYRDKPSNLNNVETFANVPMIIKNGAQWFASMGTATSKGTKVFSLVGNVKNTGLVEVPMGASLRHIVYDVGGGTLKKAFKAVQSGGPSGGCIPASMLDIPVDYEKLVETGAMMGSGGMIVMDQDTCMVDVARYFLEFLQEESCGQCTPCREGIKRLLQILTDICQGRGREGDIALLQELSATVKELSLCGLGGSAPNPVLSTIRYFRDEYESHIRDKFCPAGVCKELFQYEIDPEACTGCHACWRKCPQQAISGEKKKPHVIDQAKCIKCSICYDACKFNAVVVKPNKKQEPRQ